jgi:hypothetical protein
MSRPTQSGDEVGRLPFRIFHIMLFTIGLLTPFELSIVVHELGHAFGMRQCGVRVVRISLFGFLWA